MDAKITLSFDEEVIKKAKQYASDNNISLSRLTEFLYTQITSQNYITLEEMPISEWVNVVAEGKPEYGTKPQKRKDLKDAFFKSRKK
ncbi:MAG: DUF6364 family protein [Bacteroidota bacterium]